MATQERQASLQRLYHFVCGCEACLEPEQPATTEGEAVGRAVDMAEADRLEQMVTRGEELLGLSPENCLDMANKALTLRAKWLDSYDMRRGVRTPLACSRNSPAEEAQTSIAE